MRSPDVAAPDRLLIEIADLAGRARRDPRDLYGQLLRENVADAIRCSFPAVARMAGEVVVAAAADGRRGEANGHGARRRRLPCRFRFPR